LIKINHAAQHAAKPNKTNVLVLCKCATFAAFSGHTLAVIVEKTSNKPFTDFDKSNMIDKLLMIIKKLVNVIAYLMMGLWSILTIIVIFFLIHRWTNPGWKSISNTDLKDYGVITLISFLIVGFLFFVRFILNKRLVSK
jgi:uncharacterized BrkB/YihY/UPF0761 family membrane protein